VNKECISLLPRTVLRYTSGFNVSARTHHCHLSRLSACLYPLGFHINVEGRKVLRFSRNQRVESQGEGVSKSFRTESITKYTLTIINTREERTQRIMETKLTRLTHKIAIQLHLVAESLPFAVLAPGGQSGNFWIYHIWLVAEIILNKNS
jgi:hypothetical protein